MAAARQKEMKASMAVVATRTFAIGREAPGDEEGPVGMDAMSRVYPKLYVDLMRKKSRGGRSSVMKKRSLCGSVLYACDSLADSERKSRAHASHGQISRR